MILFVGPRLDRPSVVGDEGRPRATGLAAATAAVLVYAALLAEVVGLWRPLRAVALGVGLLVAGIALVDREDPVSPFVGHAIFLPGGLLALGGIAAAILVGPAAVLLLAGLAVALFGTAGAWADAVGRGSVTTAIQGGAVSVVIVILAAVVIPVTAGSASLVWVALEPVLLPPREPGLAGLLFVAGATAIAIRVALPRLPIVALAPRPRRPVLARRRRQAMRLATGVGLAALAGWVGVGVGELAGVVPRVTLTAGSTSLLAVLGGGPGRVVLAVIGLGSLGGAFLAWVVRRIAGLDARSARALAPIVGGVVLLGLPVPFLVTVVGSAAGDSFGLLLVVALAFALVLLGAIGVLLGLAAVSAAAGLSFLPDRAAPLALVGVGLLGTALGLGLGGAPAPLVFGGVAAAAFAWDVSEFGLGLTAELGHRPDTRRLELFHAVVGAAVGVVGVGVAIGLDALVASPVLPGDAQVPIAVLAFAGTLALLAAVRG